MTTLMFISAVKLFLTDNIIERIVDETYLYAEQQRQLGELAGLVDWKPTTPDEMKVLSPTQSKHLI